MNHTIEVPSASSAVSAALEELEAHLAALGIATEMALELRLFSEEVLTNIVKYAGVDSMEFAIQVAPHEIALEFRDDGPAFDPLALPEPDLEAELTERPLGGLGIHLIRSLADAVSYRRKGEANILRVTKKR